MHLLKQFHQLHEVFRPLKNNKLQKNKINKIHLTIPSRSIVARTCSEPGVTVKIDFALIPFSIACCAILADRVISSYELFVQLPIRPFQNNQQIKKSFFRWILISYQHEYLLAIYFSLLVGLIYQLDEQDQV